MNNTTENRYVWLIELLDRPRRLDQIQELWRHSSLNPRPDETFDRKTFRNWREHILKTYGLEIKVNRAGRNSTYEIDGGAESDAERFRNFLVENVAVQNTLASCADIRERILLEDIPSGRAYLRPVLEAVRGNRCISFDYQDYWEDTMGVVMQPYFVKLFHRHWKVIGPLEDGSPESIRSYALDTDRMKNLKVLDRTFVYPEDFSPEAFMGEHFGTSVFPRKSKPPKIYILVWAKFNWYLKSVPLHSSQELVCDCPEDSYSIFSFRLYPTESFYREICRYGDYMEILAPSDVRAEMMDIIKGMQGEYDGLSRASCKVENPLITKLLDTK